MALNDKQQRFAREYVVDLNATQAAIRAGYSEKTARQQASDLLSKPDIQEEVARLQAELAERAEVSAERVVRELAAIAFADVRDFVAFGGSTVLLKPSPDLQSAAAVQSVSGDGEKASIRLHDKIRALELLGRHVGLFKEGGLLPGDVTVTLVWPEQAADA